MSVPIDATIHRYLQHCAIAGKTPQTIRGYAWTLRQFQATLPHPSIALETIHEPIVLDFLARYAEYSPATRHRYFREVRRFFHWCVEQDLLKTQPFARLRNVRVPEKIVQPFHHTEIAALLAACSGSEPADVRDRAMVLTLLDTGIRCAECVQLALADCDLTTRRLRVLHAKGQKQRTVSFADRCADALEDYLDLRGPVAGPLFAPLNQRGGLRSGQGLQPNGLKQLLRRLGQRANLDRVHAHRFRHTFATWAIAHDARELDVQYLLGHSSPDMVRRYSATYGSEQAAQRHAAFSPGDGMASAAGGA